MEKHINIVGWFASLMSIFMYFSYIDQILLNIRGNPGSTVLPVFTTVNCLAWTAYGYFKAKRDWPIIICNVPGVFLGAIAVVTSL